MEEQLVADKIVAYQLTSISLLEVVLNKLDEEIQDELDFGFELSITHSVRPEQQSIDITVVASLLSKSINSILAKVSVGYHFDFQNFDKIEMINNKTLPRDLANMLNGVSISTTRGIFFSEVRGTKLQSVVMPIINPQQLLREKDIWF